MFSSSLGGMKRANRVCWSKKSKDFLIPKLTPELAELVGIMFGDGYMKNKHNNSHTIRICGSLSKDKDYFFYLRDLFIRNFDIDPKFSEYPNKNYLELYVYSKKLVDFFHKILLIPFSPKVNLSIPGYIKKDKRFLKSFLRGLFDTDGCVTYQKSGKYYYVLIKLCVKSESFAREIEASLKNLSIKSFCCEKVWRDNRGYDIVIRHKNTISFFNLIGSNNMRNIRKWEQEWGRWDSNF